MSETLQSPAAAVSTPAEPEKKKRGPYAKNDQRIAGDITASNRLLQTVRTDADIRPVALTYGIDDAELDEAAAKVQLAADKWGVRLEEMGGEDTLVEETDTALEAIKNDYLIYREIGRNNFPSAADRTALGLSGDIPDAFDALMTHIKAAYETAKKAPYTALMTKRNYAPARLDTLIQAIDDLVTDETDQTEAEGDAMTATRERNEAYAAMKAAIKPIKGTLKGALRNRPDLLAKLGM
jgi:hypothetical protein